MISKQRKYTELSIHLQVKQQDKRDIVPNPINVKLRSLLCLLLLSVEIILDYHGLVLNLKTILRNNDEKLTKAEFEKVQYETKIGC